MNNIRLPLVERRGNPTATRPIDETRRCDRLLPQRAGELSAISLEPQDLDTVFKQASSKEVHVAFLATGHHVPVVSKENPQWSHWWVAAASAASKASAAAV
jgi:hypothetical protein